MAIADNSIHAGYFLRFPAKINKTVVVQSSVVNTFAKKAKELQNN